MRLFSTEQVSKYHPDKYADAISDAIVTECLKQDKESHVACETMVKGTVVVLAGEITTKAKLNYEEIVGRVASDLNYEVTKIINLLSKQSPQINNAVLSSEDLGAGDQGIMFGFATNETDSYLPNGFDLANEIIARIEEDVTKENSILKGDAKTQVTMDLETNSIYKVLVSVCHKEKDSDGNKITLDSVKDYITNLLKDLVSADKLLINPSGIWTIGGPTADSGLTGRKIVCDQYGGYMPVGGGAFSGKDPTKVDRSASYMARHIAKELVKKYDEKWVKVELAYAIGVSEPMSVYVTSESKKDYTQEVLDTYNLTPKGIIEYLDLLNLDYYKLSQGCHYRGVVSQF